MVRKILIINQPTKNRGDEAAHKSLVRRLNNKFPNSEIKVIFTQNDDDTIRQFKVSNSENKYIRIKLKGRGLNGFIPKCLLLFNVYWLAYLFSGYRYILKIIKEADIVISAPGGICMGGFHNWNHLFFLYLAFLAKKKVIYYSRSIGPFPHDKLEYKIFNWHSLKLMKKMSFISLRDQKSISIAESLGVKVVSSIDTAFLDVPDARIPDEISEMIGDDYVVFVPNSLVWHHAYRNVDSQFIKIYYLKIIGILRHRFPTSNIVMLPQLFNDSKNSDYKYFLEIKSYSNSNKVIPIKDIYSSDIQQKIISKAKFVIGARYHTIVFAINNKIPFVALCYEHKISGLLKILNLLSVGVEIENICKSQKFLENSKIEIERAIDNSFLIDLDKAHYKANSIANGCFEKMSKILEGDGC